MLYILGLMLSYTISWMIVCGIIKLITLCCGLAFSWLVATGIWLILLLIKS